MNNTPYRSSVRISAIIGGSYIIARTVPRCASEIATEPVGCHQHDRESHAVTCSRLIGSHHDARRCPTIAVMWRKRAGAAAPFRWEPYNAVRTFSFRKQLDVVSLVHRQFRRRLGVAGPARQSAGSSLNRACAQPQLTVRDYRVDGENDNPVLQKQRSKPCRRPEFLRNKREPGERASHG